MTDTNIYSQSKIEYTKQLIDVLKDRLYDGIQEIFKESKKNVKLFRTNLENVIKWNQEMIELERSKIVERSKCEYIDDLITAVFISHTRILASIGKNNIKKVNLVVPKTINFIHKCYINIAREIWKNPNLFDNRTTSSEYQKNIRIIENIIKDSIEYTIRSSLPVKDILRNHLSQNIDDEIASETIKTSDIIEDKQLDNKDKLINDITDDYTNMNTTPVKYGNEDVYDNDNIIVSDDEEHMIKKVIDKDNDKEDHETSQFNNSIIEQINNIKPEKTEQINSDVIDDEKVTTSNFSNNIDMFKDIPETEQTNNDFMSNLDDYKNEETKIISDLEKKTNNDIKDIRKIEVEQESDPQSDIVIINDTNNNDDTETVDGILDDIEKLNNNEEYTLFE